MHTNKAGAVWNRDWAMSTQHNQTTGHFNDQGGRFYQSACFFRKKRRSHSGSEPENGMGSSMLQYKCTAHHLLQPTTMREINMLHFLAWRWARWLRLEVTFSWLSRSQILSFSSTLTKGILHSLTIVWELRWNVVVLITALFLRGYATPVFFSPTDFCKPWLWLINLQIRSSIWTNSKC